MKPSTPLQIGLFLYPSCMPFGMFAIADLVHAANQRVRRTLFETKFVAIDSNPVSCSHGHRVVPAQGLSGAALDVLIVPPSWTESVDELCMNVEAQREVIDAIRAQRGSELMGFCSGVFLLAASGRLAGHSATINWWLAELVRKQYPEVGWNVERNLIAHGGRTTASGVNSHFLLAKELIDRHAGPEVFHEMVKLMNLQPPSQIHEVFQGMDIVQQGDEFMRQLFLVAQDLPATSITVRRLADQLCTTERTLARRVIAATGLPAASYLRKIKLHQVSQRLMLTSTPASSISDSLGFSSESSMRRMFKDLTGMTPAEYRDTYRRV